MILLGYLDLFKYYFIHSEIFSETCSSAMQDLMDFPHIVRDHIAFKVPDS